MNPLIKNCGLKHPTEIDAALASGADFIGFVHHKASPRHVTREALLPLLMHVGTHPALKSVAVLVNPRDDLLDGIMAVAQPDYFQLHDIGNLKRLAEIKGRYGLPIITAVALTSADDLRHVGDVEMASDHVLFDAKSPGSGAPFDWKLLAEWKPLTPKAWFLSGGLTAANVGEALRITHAPGVDVSSGIESTRGIKSLEMIAAFNAAVLNASA
ncbi:MAG: phosphoribosylanthranilate isomerase [Rickettsiales bacterium]